MRMEEERWDEVRNGARIMSEAMPQRGRAKFTSVHFRRRCMPWRWHFHIIASKSICLRLENSRRGVAACVKDAYAPPEGLPGPHALRWRGDCTQAVLSPIAAAAACKRAKSPRSAADDYRCIKRVLIVRPSRG